MFSAYIGSYRRWLFVSSISLLLTSPTYAWSNYFRFLNNFNTPITLSITPTLANVNDSDGGDNKKINQVIIAPHALSNEFEFTTEKEHWYSSPANKGTITLALQNDPQSFCTYNYNYTFTPIPYSYFSIHSENISLQSCQGKLSSKEISVINDSIKALPRPLDGNIILSKAYQVTESLSQADCGGKGGDNCMIVSPDLDTLYKENGSTLGQSLALQAKLDRFEPLNFEQFIGSHNSAISRQYTKSTGDFNLSYSDPDNFLNLTDQLNAGVRQIELDIEWYNDSVTICHNHVSQDLQGILCDNNAPLSQAINDIKAWVEKNPHELILVYLDVNLPLTGHTAELDAELANLEPYVFTPAMATEYYHVDNNTLPAFQLTQQDIVKKFQKNIIITNDDDVGNLKNSRYVFVSVKNSPATPLYENAVDALLASPYKSCSDLSKYDNMKLFFDGDPEHYNLLRINSDRTVINFISSIGNKDPDQYSNYFTLQNLPNMLNCPVNIYSSNMLGYTCDSSDCSTHPTDPRLATMLWSWELSYPLQQGSNIAYINAKTGHFENNALTIENNAALCYKKKEQKTPTAPRTWFLLPVNLSDVNAAYDVASAACLQAGGVFAVPTTSYWMHDVMLMVKSSIGANRILVNYVRHAGEWVPNS